MNFANDSMHTSLCLQFPPDMIATSCVYMSAQYCGITGMEGRCWLDILDGGGCNMDILMLISISIQILEVISDRKGSDKFVFDSILDDIEKLRLSHINSRHDS